MNTNTGRLKELADITENEKGQYVEVKRDLTAKERADMQIRLYSPCACGSGKKFKFCCKTTIPTKPLQSTPDSGGQ